MSWESILKNLDVAIQNAQTMGELEEAIWGKDYYGYPNRDGGQELFNAEIGNHNDWAKARFEFWDKFVMKMRSQGKRYAKNQGQDLADLKRILQKKINYFTRKKGLRNRVLDLAVEEIKVEHPAFFKYLGDSYIIGDRV